MKALLIMALALFILQIQAYDYYKFAVELPGAVCRSKNCNPEYLGHLGNNTLNLHGMWPNSNTGKMIQDCLTNNYDESQLNSSVLNEINANWVGLYDSSAAFRSHEWGKHGTCWAQQTEKLSNMTEPREFLSNKNLKSTYFQAMNDYFQIAASLKIALNIEKALFTQDTKERQMTLSQLHNALTNQLGVSTFDLTCSTVNGEVLLDEIRFCLDLKYKPMECPTTNVQCSQTKEITLVGAIN